MTTQQFINFVQTKRNAMLLTAHKYLSEAEDAEDTVQEVLMKLWSARERIGSPEEVADLAYFLTVTNRSITGEDILIDNGEMLKANFIW